MSQLANLTTYFSGESASFLSAIKQSRGGLRSLIATLDPAAAATDRFNKQQALLDNALKRGKLSIEQHTALLGRLRKRYDDQATGMTRVIGVTGSMRSGMQQLSYQLGDVSTMWALGAAPMRIFASQSGQIIQSMQLMSGSGNKLTRFLGGPWGMAMTTAAIVLAPLIGKLIEGADVSKELKDRLSDAADGADAFGDAQSLLGKMVDLTTGKLKSHNDVLKATIRLQAILNQQQAAEEKETAQKSIRSAADHLIGTGFGLNTPGGTAVSPLKKRPATPEAMALGRLVTSGVVKIDSALQSLQALNTAGKITDETFRELSSQFVEFGQATEKSKAAKAILDYLDNGTLDPRLKKEPKTRKTRQPKDRSAQYESRFLNELDSLKADQLSLQQQLTTDLETRAMLEHQRVADDQVAYDRSLAERVKAKELTQAQADRLRLANDENIEQQHRLINYRLDDDLSQQTLKVRSATMDAQADQLNFAYSAARTERERRDIALKLLALSIERQRLEQQAVLSSATSTDAEKKIAQMKLDQLGLMQKLGTAQINRENASPLARYLDSLPRTAEEASEAYEAAAADGLASFNDGLADAIAGTKSLGDVFKDVTGQIIADLARIMVQRSITMPLAKALFGGGGLGGLFGGSGLTSGFGGGSGVLGSGFDISGVSTGISFGGFRARGGGVDAWKAYRVGEEGEEMFVPAVSGSIISNDRLHAANDHAPIVFDLRGAVMTEDLLRQMNDMATGASVRGAVGGAALAQQQGRRARRRALA